MKTERNVYRLAARPALATAILLLVPLLAMQFTDEVVWTGFDFAVAGALLFGTGFLFELALNRASALAYRAAAGLALPLLLWLAWRQVPLERLGATLLSIQAWQVGFLVVLNGLVLLLFNLRWWLILRAQGHSLPYLQLTAYRLAGFAVSYLTPGTQFGGEPLQAALLHRRHNLLLTTSIASVTLDKLLELLVNYIFLTILLLGVLQNSLSQSLLPTNLLWPLVVLLFIPLAHLIALRQGIRPVTRLFAWLSDRWHTPKIEGLHQLVSQVEGQVGAFCKEHLFIVISSVLFSLVVWVLAASEHWLVYAFLGLRLSLSQLVLLLAAMRLAFLTPLPGGLGALEASQVLALQALRLDPAVGVGVVLWIRLRDLALAGAGAWLGATLSHSEVVISLPEEAGVQI